MPIVPFFILPKTSGRVSLILLLENPTYSSSPQKAMAATTISHSRKNTLIIHSKNG